MDPNRPDTEVKKKRKGGPRGGRKNKASKEYRRAQERASALLDSDDSESSLGEDIPSSHPPQSLVSGSSSGPAVLGAAAESGIEIIETAEFSLRKGPAADAAEGAPLPEISRVLVSGSSEAFGSSASSSSSALPASAVPSSPVPVGPGTPQSPAEMAVPDDSSTDEEMLFTGFGQQSASSPADVSAPAPPAPQLDSACAAEVVTPAASSGDGGGGLASAVNPARLDPSLTSPTPVTVIMEGDRRVWVSTSGKNCKLLISIYDKPEAERYAEEAVGPGDPRLPTPRQVEEWSSLSDEDYTTGWKAYWTFAYKLLDLSERLEAAVYHTPVVAGDTASTLCRQIKVAMNTYQHFESKLSDPYARLVLLAHARQILEFHTPNDDTQVIITPRPAEPVASAPMHVESESPPPAAPAATVSTPGPEGLPDSSPSDVVMGEAEVSLPGAVNPAPGRAPPR